MRFRGVHGARADHREHRCPALAAFMHCTANEGISLPSTVVTELHLAACNPLYSFSRLHAVHINLAASTLQ